MAGTETARNPNPFWWIIIGVAVLALVVSGLTGGYFAFWRSSTPALNLPGPSQEGIVAPVPSETPTPTEGWTVEEEGRVTVTTPTPAPTPTPMPTPTQVPQAITIVEPDWRCGGPGGESQITWFGFDPNDRTIVYAAQYATGFWKSEDDGKSWEFVGRSLTSSIETNRGLMRTEDGGKTWEYTKYPTQRTPEEWRQIFQSKIIPQMTWFQRGLAAVPAGLDTQRLYEDGDTVLGVVMWMSTPSTRRILLSIDKGYAWTEIATPPFAGGGRELNPIAGVTTPESVKLFAGSVSEGIVCQAEIPHRELQGLPL